MNLSALGADLTKDGGVPYQWDAGAITVQTVTAGDVYVAATVVQLDTYEAFGLDTQDRGPSWEDIDFAIYLAGGELRVSESPDDGIVYGPFGTYSIGDTFAVAVEGGAVHYYHNGSLFYTSTRLPAYPLHFDSSFADPGAQLDNILMGVGPSPTPGGPSRTPTAVSGTPTSTPTPGQNPKSGISANDPVTCPLFPANNIWNRRVDALPTAVSSTVYANTLGASATLHPGFGSGTYQGFAIGFVYNVVPAAQPAVPITFTNFASQSEPGPYPYPTYTYVQGATAQNPAPLSGDRHTAVLQAGSCLLYETWHAAAQPDGSWTAANGAVWNMNSNALRPAGWTAADAAGFALLPSIIRYDEVAAGQINHAIRVTGLSSTIRNSYVWPARHSDGSSSLSSAPPMGTRFRLKASVAISLFSPRVQVILTALKRYGAILSDSGDAWQIGGTTDQRWDDTDMHSLNSIAGSDFEAVDEASLMIDPDSGQSR